MKKILALFLALCCIVSLAACSSQQGQEEKPNGQDYFNGKVLEIHDTYILVECLDVTSGAITSGTTAKVSTEVVNAHGTPEMNLGDNVRVVFKGVKEKDPVSFDTVFSIFLLDENDEVIPFDVDPATNNVSIPTELPELKIAYGEEEITAWLGSHSWIYEDEKGEKNAIIKESNHPLHCMETMSFIPVSPTTISHAVGYEPGQVTLNFDVEPTKITVYRYDVETADETAGEEIIMDNGYVLDLSFGNYLYHIAAEWDYPDNELGGSGDYAFYTKAPEIYNPQAE